MGKDASTAFDDEEHSLAAEKEMKQFYIGDVKAEEEEEIDTSNPKK